MQTLHSISGIVRAKPSGKKIGTVKFLQNGPVKCYSGPACAGVQQNEVCRTFLRLCKACGIRHAEGLNERFICQLPQTADVAFILLPVELGNVDDACIQQISHRFRCFVHEHAHSLNSGGKLCF